jgi:hypothetical protein
MLVSLLMPTRGRVDHLQKSLASLQQTVSDPSRIEVLIRIDSDDQDTLSFLHRENRPYRTKALIGNRGNGYADLHLFYNQLCSIAMGRFLFLWNDDATMLSNGWDDEIARHDDGKLCYLRSAVSDSRGRDSYLFPIVHRSYYEALGHYSRSAHNDTYVCSIFQALPGTFRDTNIVVGHSALELIKAGDKTSMEAKQWWPTTKGLWGSPEVQQGLQDDIAKLQDLLKQQQ